MDMFIANVNFVVMSLVNHEGEPGVEVALERTLQRIPTIAQHLWDNRERLGVWHPDHFDLSHNPGCVLILAYFWTFQGYHFEHHSCVL